MAPAATTTLEAGLRPFTRERRTDAGGINLADALIDEHIRAGRGECLALASEDGAVTYGELGSLVDLHARVLLDIGVRRGDRVVIRVPGALAFAVAWLAVQKIGAIGVAVSPGLSPRELAHVFSDSRPSACVVVERDRRHVLETLGRLRQTARCLAVVDARGGFPHGEVIGRARACDEVIPVWPSPDDPAILSYVTTPAARPRTVAHTSAQLLAGSDNYARGVLGATSGDVFGGALPLWFAYALGSLLIFPLRLGAASVPVTAFSADALLRSLQARRVTLLFGTATAYRLLLKVPGLDADALASVRLCVSAGQHLDAGTCVEWARRTGRDLLDGFGTTEMFQVFLGSRPGAVVPGAVGTPVPGYEVQLLDPAGRIRTGPVSGRLAVRGPTRGARWPGAPLPDDAWLLTGDRLERDRADRYWFKGRDDGVIVSAGYNIAAAEVDLVLSAHPLVEAAAVVDVPDPVRGAVLEAVVVWRPGVAGGASAITALREHAQAELSAYKCPRRYREASVLPRTATGAVDREALRCGIARRTTETDR